MPREQADANHEAQTMQAITEDLEPAHETAAVVSGGDTTPVTMTSNLLQTKHDTAQNSINNLR